MLRETERKIIDIAFDSGFESLRTFNRAFIRSFGITPNAYRKKGN
jgi:AraC-like DNA-binding protein